MANTPRDLTLQLAATTELLRSQLVRADQAVADFERQTNQRLTNVDRGFDGLGRGLSTFEGRMRTATASSGQMRAGMQQLGFQLQDVAVQFASGTSAAVIFAQQSGQVIQAVQMMSGGTNALARFLGGPWGQAITIAAVALSPFIARLFDTGTEADRAKDKIEGLKQAMDRLHRGASTPQDRSDIDINRRTNQAELNRIRARLASETRNRPLPGELRNVLLRQAEELESKIANADALLRGVELQDQARAKLDALNAKGSGQGGSRGASSNPMAARIQQVRAQAELAIPSIEKMAEALGKLELTGGFQDPVTIASKRAQEFYSQLGIDPFEGVRKFVEESEQRGEENSQAWQDWYERGKQRVQGLADFFESAMTGAGGSFFDQFKRLGLRTVAEIAARLLTNNGGQGGGLGSILTAVGSSIFSGFGFANGGSPPVGKISLVGERGPELFVPKVPGTIIPNHMLGAANDRAPVSLTINAPGATAETVAMIRRELMNAAPMIVEAAASHVSRQQSRARL